MVLLWFIINREVLSLMMSMLNHIQGRVVMGTQAVSPYQQVIEKTKNLAFRSQMLVMNIEKKLASKDQEVMSSLIDVVCNVAF